MLLSAHMMRYNGVNEAFETEIPVVESEEDAALRLATHGSQLLCRGSLRDIGDWWRRRCLNVRLSCQILEPVLDCRVVLVVD